MGAFLYFFGRLFGAITKERKEICVGEYKGPNVDKVFKRSIL